MSLQKEAAIAARKEREAAMAAAMNNPGLPGLDAAIAYGNRGDINVAVNVSGSVVGSQDLQREIFNAIYGGNRYGFPSSITGR